MMRIQEILRQSDYLTNITIDQVLFESSYPILFTGYDNNKVINNIDSSNYGFSVGTIAAGKDYYFTIKFYHKGYKTRKDKVFS